MKFIAHRGACLEATENTLDALARGAAYGAYAVECDPRPTKDGKLVIFHDDTVKRLAGDERRVCEMTYVELKDRLAYVGISLCTFDEVLEQYNGSAAVLFDLAFDASNDEAVFKAMASAPFRAIAGVHNVDEAKLARRFLPAENVLAFMPSPTAYEAFHNAGCGILRLWEDWLNEVTPTDIKTHVGQTEVWIMAHDNSNTHPLYCMNGSPASIDRAAALGADGMLLNDIRMAVSCK